MKTNESALDRIIRVIAGIALLAVGIFGGIVGAWQIVAIVVGAVLLLTGLTGFCLIYKLFNFSTNKK